MEALEIRAVQAANPAAGPSHRPELPARSERMVIKMDQLYTITDKYGRPLKQGAFTEPEVRMIAKAGFRVFDQSQDGREITPELTGLFQNKDGEP